MLWNPHVDQVDPAAARRLGKAGSAEQVAQSCARRALRRGSAGDNCHQARSFAGRKAAE